jgi:hypothetical protein
VDEREHGSTDWTGQVGPCPNHAAQVGVGDLVCKGLCKWSGGFGRIRISACTCGGGRSVYGTEGCWFESSQVYLRKQRSYGDAKQRVQRTVQVCLQPRRREHEQFRAANYPGIHRGFSCAGCYAAFMDTPAEESLIIAQWFESTPDDVIDLVADAVRLYERENLVALGVMAIRSIAEEEEPIKHVDVGHGHPQVVAVRGRLRDRLQALLSWWKAKEQPG